MQNLQLVPWCNKKKSQNLETNLLDVKEPNAGDVATNMIDLDWKAKGKNETEVLANLTALPEWENMK